MGGAHCIGFLVFRLVRFSINGLGKASCLRTRISLGGWFSPTMPWAVLVVPLIIGTDASTGFHPFPIPSVLCVFPSNHASFLLIMSNFATCKAPPNQALIAKCHTYFISLRANHWTTPS